MKSTSSYERGNRRVSRSTIVAVSFLVISLGVSLALLIRRQANPSAIPVETTVETKITGSPASATLPESIAATPIIPTETAESDGIIISLAPIRGGDPGIAERLDAAITESLATTSFGNAVQITQDIVIPPGVSTEAMNQKADLPGVDLLITWGKTSEGLQEIWIALVSAPAMAGLEGNLEAWWVLTPGDLAILVDPEGDLSFTAEIVSASLELQRGESTSAEDRIRALQTSSTDESVLITDAQQAVIQLMLGAAEAQNGQTIEALQRASQATRLRNDSWMAHLNRGSVYLQLGDATSALSEIDLARGQAPDYWPAIYNCVLANEQLGQYENALADAELLQALQPDEAWAANLVGVIQYRQGDLVAARDQFQAAAALAPEAQIPLVNLAITQGVQRDYENAIGTYDTLLDLAPNSSQHFLNQALMYQALEKYPQAEFGMNRAIDLDPASLDAYLLRGKLHLQMEAYDRATNDAQLALDQNPESGEAYAILGEVALADEDFEAARDAFTNSIDRGNATAAAYEGRGWAWHQLRYTGFAVDDYEEALALGETDSQLLLRLGFALLDAGRYEDSLDALLGAVNLGLDTPEAHAGLAIALDRNGKKDEADTEYQQAITSDSHYGDTEFLAAQPMWTSAIVQGAETILRRLP
jgi:tetratricopeptide (TPR) repeat protein